VWRKKWRAPNSKDAGDDRGRQDLQEKDIAETPKIRGGVKKGKGEDRRKRSGLTGEP